MKKSGLTLAERCKTDLGGFYLESDFFDGDNFYVNAVLLGAPTDAKIRRANSFVREVAENMAHAMNLDNPGEDWVPYVSELNWWGDDGEELEDDEYGRENVHVIQCTIRR